MPIALFSYQNSEETDLYYIGGALYSCFCQCCKVVCYKGIWLYIHLLFTVRSTVSSIIVSTVSLKNLFKLGVVGLWLAEGI